MGLIVDELRDAHGRWTAGGADVELSPSGQGHFGGVSTVRVNGASAGHVSARGHSIYDAVSADRRLVSTGHPSKRAAANAVAAHHVKAHGSPVSRGLGPEHQQLKPSTNQSSTQPSTVWAPYAGREFRFAVVAREGDHYIVKLPGSDAGTMRVPVASSYPSDAAPHSFADVHQA